MRPSRHRIRLLLANRLTRLECHDSFRPKSPGIDFECYTQRRTLGCRHPSKAEARLVFWCGDMIHASFVVPRVIRAGCYFPQFAEFDFHVATSFVTMSRPGKYTDCFKVSIRGARHNADLGGRHYGARSGGWERPRPPVSFGRRIIQGVRQSSLRIPSGRGVPIRADKRRLCSAVISALYAVRNPAQASCTIPLPWSDSIKPFCRADLLPPRTGRIEPPPGIGEDFGQPDNLFTCYLPTARPGPEHADPAYHGILANLQEIEANLGNSLPRRSGRRAPAPAAILPIDRRLRGHARANLEQVARQFQRSPSRAARVEPVRWNPDASGRWESVSTMSARFQIGRSILGDPR